MSEGRILDRRGRLRRAVVDCWRRWDERPPALVRAAATLTGALSRRGLQRRLARRGSPPDRPFIVSIGNLALGGTGKTPVVIALASALERRGRAVAVLTRGYGSDLSGPLVVGADDARCGDEARLMAAALPACRIVQARDRAAGLEFAREDDRPPDIVLVEDGHQSAGPARHLDCLILDRWRTGPSGALEPHAGLTIPWGPYREGVRGADRAGVWLVEEGAAAGDPAASIAGDPRVIRFRRRLLLDECVSAVAAAHWGIVSGIGRPEAFERALAAELGGRPGLCARFDDHHRYARRDVESLLDAGRREGVTAWLTTAKDAVKLRALWPADVPLHTVGLRIEWPAKRTLPDRVEERCRGR